ncbi:uncharacterized protein LOC120685855 isoform X2 [Panicum virgatum]|uniref:Retrovirus-related Pol polyprotein from transposon TNT 1-94-like beta-barrel domain-containing protein n=1 Tax=Panicum virgatum TaxID=38727 RepID=A0A8T0P879_PANVG|nr:uncharacterized protein LOC120685855 isoform X2 [Panicum virgatum]KAG2557188.1 hypothetical protein PVAP13_8NG182002 [Panicum virgatum]
MASTASPPAASELDSYLTEMESVNDGVVSAGNGKGVRILPGRIVDSTWLFDSCATNHMTGDLNLLTGMVPVSNKVVGTGSGKGMQVHGTGSVLTEAVVLPDVWYVPGLAARLVSVTQLTNDNPNLFIRMLGTACLVTKISDGSVIGSAHLRSDNKYEVDFLRIQQN